MPNQKVIVYLEKGEELIEQWETYSDNEGHWSIEKDGLLESGEYKISTVTEDSRGAVSKSSLSKTVMVTLNGIVIGPWIISCQSLVVLLIVLFVILCIFLFDSGI